MNYTKSMIFMLAVAGLMTSCKDDDMKNPGNPVMDITGNLGSACFGDTLRFDIKASDSEVPLSTIHADLYYETEKVYEQVIRTKVSGETYPVAIYIPYIADIPDGQASLVLTLQNINFTTTTETYAVNITHADYPYLTFVSDEGEEYRMDRESMYNYSMTEKFPAKLSGKIIAPAQGGATDEVIFGYEGSEIVVNGSSSIPFTNTSAGEYTVKFNTYSFEGSPFVSLTINGQTLTAIDDNNLYVDLNLAKGDELTLDGFPEFENWWLNPDFFQKNDDGTLSFMAYNGSYRLIANLKLQYFQVVKLSGGAPATLNEDGTGAVWILGENIGYPNLNNAPGWNEGKGICMAPTSENTYQVTVVGGKNIDVSAINFKFFGQDGWGTELTGSMLTSESDLIGVGHGDDGHDNGNLYLKEGVTLDVNGVYVITLDLSAGINNAILKTDLNGEQEFDEKPVYIDGQKMETSDNATYSLMLAVNTGDTFELTGNVDMNNIYVDPDYFSVSGNALSFEPISGYYNIVLSLETKSVTAVSTDEAGTELTLNENGTGALWVMGTGAGNPSIDYEFGWTPGKAYCMAQHTEGVYQFTGKAGSKDNAKPGDRFCIDALQIKFFWQDGWGGEFSGDNNLTMIGDSENYVHLQDDGNFFLNNGVTLEEGATYRVTVDLSQGVESGTFNFEKL